MGIREVESGYCIKCGEIFETKDENKECQVCGCKSIALGSNFIRKNDEGQLMCICLNDEFKHIHMDYSDYCKDVYRCKYCGNCITVDTFREMF